MSVSVGSPFSTFDFDDNAYPMSCAVSAHGAWWYPRYAPTCTFANLNGEYLNGPHQTPGDGVNWATWRGIQYSLRKTEMKIRPTE